MGNASVDCRSWHSNPEKKSYSGNCKYRHKCNWNHTCNKDCTCSWVCHKDRIHIDNCRHQKCNSVFAPSKKSTPTVFKTGSSRRPKKVSPCCNSVVQLVFSGCCSFIALSRNASLSVVVVELESVPPNPLLLNFESCVVSKTTLQVFMGSSQR